MGCGPLSLIQTAGYHGNNPVTKEGNGCYGRGRSRVYLGYSGGYGKTPAEIESTSVYLWYRNLLLYSDLTKYFSRTFPLPFLDFP